MQKTDEMELDGRIGLMRVQPVDLEADDRCWFLLCRNNSRGIRGMGMRLVSDQGAGPGIEQFRREW